MNRLLLSLWLLGAVLFGANTLFYMNLINGWPGPKHKIDVSGAGKEGKPGPDTKAPNQSRDRSPAEIAESQSPEPNASPTDAPVQPGPGETATAPPPAQPARAENVPTAEPQQQAETPSAVPPQQPQQQAETPSAALPQPATESPPPGGAEWVRVARHGANMRSGPSSSASQLAMLPPGMALRVISREGGWVQIANSDGSRTGWVYEGLLEPLGSSSEENAAPQESERAAGMSQQEQGEWVKVSGGPATMRGSPSESAPMLFAFPEGRQLRVVSRQPGWVEVMDPGSTQSGWIAETSLAAAGAQSQQQQAAAPPPQRPNRDAYDGAEGPPPPGWVPWDEDVGPPDAVDEPRDRARGRVHRHHGGFAGILRRAFGGF